MNHTFVKALRAVLVVMMMLLTGSNALAGVVVRGNVYGGGNEADVQTNTAVNISAGQVDGNVYGGGNLGDVGNITKNTTNYNYSWKQTDGSTANAEHNNTFAANANNNTGISTVTISGGTIGTVGSSNTDYTQVSTGNVFGGGRGNSNAKFYCEEGMVYATSVTISNGTTVYGCVYGGGEIGRVEDDTKVTITGTSQTGIKGNVFGAGKGLKTHGYSALVRGNTEVTVEGNSKIGHSVFGGGETASLGKFVVVGGNPATPNGGGGSTVTIQGSAHIGGDVFGAGKGVTPENYTYTITDKTTMPRRMMAKSMGSFTDANSAIWTEVDEKNVWEYFPTSVIYHDFLRTLALASTPTVTIGGTATIAGSVYGGGELGITLGEVNVSMTGGTVGGDVYGGGALADTNTGNWSLNNYVTADASNLSESEKAELFTRSGEGTAQSPYKHSRYINSTLSTGQLYRRVPIWANATDKSSTYTTHVSLTGGTISGDAYGGGLGQKAREASGGQAALEDIEAMVYGDVKVELNGKTVGSTTTQVADGAKGCIVSRVFGCNNLNGTPKGHVKVYVWGTQSSGSGNNTIIDKYDKHSGMAPNNDPTPYDVAAVYGGGNLAAYVPVDALLEYNETNKTTVEAAKTEVYINGCDRTSIKQVYAGGNAASVSGSYVVVNSVYEIEEVFGGGNGADAYTLNGKKYLNPGANVGYYNYTNFGDSGKGTGTNEDPYQPVDNPNALTKENRQANYRYGSGIAETDIRGGKIHVVYGGSNKKGNISTTALSVYEGSDVTCPMSVGQTYGGGKDAPIDGEVQVELACATGIEEIFGGAKNADVDNDINLRITNGSSLNRVFGGNNTSGAINGSITVTVEEGGCEPIRIGELYLGGYLAPYSVYGYEKNADGTYKYKEGATDEEGNAINERIPLTSGSNPKNDPRLFVVSATHIGDIFGGGYKAKLVGNPHINVNMQQGKVYVTKTETNNTESPAFLDNDGKYYEYKDGHGTTYAQASVTTEGTGDQTKFYSMLPVGVIGNVYGGGNMADIVGDTYVEIGTGSYHNDAGTVVVLNPARNAANITGNVFGGGKGSTSDETTALVSGNTNITIGNGAVGKSIYGGGELAQIGGNTNITVNGGTIGTTGLGGATYGNVYGGGFGTATYGTGTNPATIENYKLFGLIKGNTNVTVENVVADATYAAAHEGVNTGDIISSPTIIHNIYGGGAYGSVGEYTYDSTTGIPTSRQANTTGGIANVTITGGTIGTTGQDNGMIFGSSRGDVAAPIGGIDPNDRLAWVYNANVVIGTSGQGTTLTTPLINGSVYGSGENGHTMNDTDIKVYSGTIGIASGVPITNDNGTPNNTDDDITYNGAEYPYRGNVYGGGCGTDMYDTDNDNEGDTYNPLAGIVRGNATITITGGQVVHNVYGAGAMGSVGTFTKDNNNVITFTNGGTTTIGISGGIIGVSGTVGDGNVFGAARGDKATTEKDLALVKETDVTVSGTTTTTQIKGNVYGGGEVGNVHTNTKVDIQGGAIARNVFGGGKGVEDLFTCEQAMVGVDGEGAGADLDSNDNKNKGTIVTISNGTVGTLETVEGKNKVVEGTGNVYGGGEIGRVEWNTQVKIGVGTGEGTFEPIIYGNVFGAGKGLETHGYSALVRGNSTVTVQGGANIGENVYGGGENSTVGRYWVKGINNNVENAPEAPSDLPDGMPYQKQSGGICKVYIQGNAEIGINGTNDKGHVFGAGKGVDTRYVASGENQSKKMTDGNTLVGFTDETVNGVIVKTAEQLYYEFLQTLALVTETHVTIDGSAQVNGSVFGGSESGFVQTDTDVKIQGSNCVIGTTKYGNVFGGGKGLEYFAEAGKVKGNTKVEIIDGTIKGNVYGGGRLGDVGIIDKSERGEDGKPTYNYFWKKTDGTTRNTDENNKITGNNTNTGVCTVTISGGTIGLSSTDKPKEHGNVFGAGRGSSETWWCEKAMAFATNVTVKKSGSANTLAYGNVYGGGEVGRVADDTKVTIGTAGGSDEPDIKGDVYGAGAGKETHGYSALVRGNALVTVQGSALVEGSVYGGGEIASVGKFTVVGGLPTKPENGGTCTVNILDNARIGASGTGHNVFGACKGVTPHYNSSRYKDVYSMQTYENRPDPKETPGDTWDYWETYAPGFTGQMFIKRYYKTETAYLDFLKTLALTSEPHVTIGGTWTKVGDTETITPSGTPTVYGSVYGGGQRGVTLGSVDVNMIGGTVEQDVYGGGALADTNLGNWDVNGYVVATALNEGESITNLYTRTGTEGNYTYTKVTDSSTEFVSGTYYRQEATWTDATLTSALYTTSVDLTGGTIKGDAYGGGLGQLARDGSVAVYYTQDEANAYNTEHGLSQGDEGFVTTSTIKTPAVAAVDAIPATVYGDIKVQLGDNGVTNATRFNITKYDGKDIVKSGRVFGCNNLNGSPQGNVTVDVWKTVTRLDNTERTTITKNATTGLVETASEPHNYDVAAVYGGGNLASYEPATSGKKTHVIIETCDVSVESVYGGGNAAAVPETDVLVKGAYEIESLFGGGNGRDKYTLDNGSSWIDNPGANVNGNAKTIMTGGFIHEAYGGSNKKGTITGNVTIDTADGDSTDPNVCTLDLRKMVAAGKNADVDGDLIVVMGCKTSRVPVLYAGADDANVNGNVELTITSGSFGKVFGGNNEGGAIRGHIKLNIEETGNCDPIVIDELYLGGNMAAYSQYGYYLDTDGETFVPRTAAMASLNQGDEGYHAPASGRIATPYAAPELNIVACTYIGKVFGGGLGSGATIHGDPKVNINMIQGSHANDNSKGVPSVMTTKGLTASENPNKLGIIGDVFGGGNEATVEGNPTVNVGMLQTVKLHQSYDETTIDETHDGYIYSDEQNVLGAYIVGNVFGGGNQANVTGDTHVNICGTQAADSSKENGYADSSVSHSGTFAVSIGNSIYGGGNAADVLGNTFVTMADGYVFNGIFGGGYSGSVGTFTTSTAAADVNKWGQHTAHEGCIGMPTACKSGTGTCYVVVSGGQIGPVTVATEGMNRKTNGHGDPVPQGWVWGAGFGLVEDPSVPAYQDTHFKTYVNNTDVTIKGNAFILESIIGGGEFGRVLGNTLVKIEGGQIGIGKNMVDGNNKPIRYTDDQWTEAEAAVRAGDASRINTIAAAMPECSHFPFGRNTNAGTEQPANWVYDCYDPYADKWNTDHNGTDKYAGGSTDHASDGKTWIGCVFAGGSGYMPYIEEDKDGKITDYDWVPSAGWVGGNTELRITGGHILTNVYGGNEYTDVNGKCKVTMTGGTIGVPRTVEQIIAHPLTCYLFGAGKGDPRVHFNKATNVGDVEIEITGGTIFGSVFGGGEDGHVLRDVKMTIGADGVNGASPTGPFIGTWGTSYVDGNVFGGGRGFSGDAYTAGNVAGSVKMEIKGGTMLGSVYGGGRLGSVGYGLFEATVTSNNQTIANPNYGVMQDDNKDDEGNTTNYYKEGAVRLGRGHIDIDISGGTIGNSREYILPADANIPSTIVDANDNKNTDISTWSANDWMTWKTHNNIPKTEFDTTTGRLKHTKGGNVFAGGMGNFYKQDGSTYISDVNWWQLGCVKSTTLTITGGTIKSNVYGGGELGQVVGYHTVKNAANEDVNVSTEISISGSSTIIGTEVKDANDETSYTFGSVFGSGYGSLVDEITANGVTSKPKFIAGLVKEDTKIDMQGGAVKASIYGGGEMASVGGSTTSGQTTTATGSTYVTVSGGTVGIAPITLSDNTKRYFGGAQMGNVYGGGSGHGNTVRSGQVFMNSNVAISGGTIYHNVYGGGAYGTIGDFIYTEDPNENNKVIGVESRKTANTGVATVTITGGTIGYDGKENGLVFGSSRGDINAPGKRDDHTAWVYDTHVTIGTSGSQTGPQINGTVYGSGENGHVFHDTEVNVYSGTIGIASGSAITYTENGQSVTKGGAEYPYRGNVYGGGCGTDKYYSDPTGVDDPRDGNGDTFNPLAGIVYGTTTVNINGGTVVRNVYGAGAMGSVGRTVTTTNSDNSTTTTYSGGSTTINVSGGVIGVSGTVGDGNVFGAARGDLSATGDYISQVRLTNVTVSGGTVKGNVYGGGELGDVGTIDKSDQTDYNYFWTDKDGSANIHGNNGISGTNNNTGICTVTVSGGTIGTDATTMNADGSFDNGNVFGAGKGSGSTWWCEKAIAYGTNVTVTAGTVKGSVYGGGEVGRVEDDAKVTIGSAPNDAPTINGSVFGAGKGLKTHGYSALVRGNAEVIVQGKSVVRGSVYGGGEIASVGRFHVDKGLPVKPMNGGTCKVLIQDEAQIGSSGTGHNVFGACKGVKSAYDLDNYKNFKSMQTEANGAKGTKGTDWDYYEDYPQGYTGHKFVWKYYTTEAAYLSFLKTLALTSNTHVTIDEDASVYGSVFGGGERGVTLGGVDVNITGGTVNEDVYGGGSLADSNTAMWDAKENERVDYVELTELIAETSATGYYTKSGEVYTLLSDATAKVESGTTYYAKYKTNVNLKGGTIVGSVYGGGLGQLAKAAVNYTEEEATTYNTTHNLTEGDADYKTTASVKVAALSAVEAKVYGDVLVNLNETTESDNCVIGSLGNANDPVSKNGNIFGCNNLNGSPQAGVTVHIHKTAQKNNEGNVTAKPDKNKGTYELQAVYGGGNLAAYYPDDATSREKAKANVIIDGCGLTSIGTVYGGGNAASVPATEVVVNGTYEIGQVFGGGNGADDYQIDGKWYDNPGANVGYRSYAYFVKEGETGYSATTHGSGTLADPYKVFEYTSSDGPDKDASTKEKRIANYAYGIDAYGIGKTHVTIYRGTVHEVYGGSNSRGNVYKEARATLEDLTTSPDDDDCPFDVTEAYGGGRNAPMDGDAVLEIGCISGLGKAYGGAANADVNGNVVLNITNGTYGQVFGGNDLGGNITGSITVNIEETGCRPVIIGELYGGGNMAGYSIYGYKKVTETDKTTGEPVQVWKPRESSTDSPAGVELSIPATIPESPQVNVKSFTSIGNVYGGGYGGPATMVGSPEVNINVFKGKFAETYNGNDNVIEDNARIVGSTVTTNASLSGYGSGYPVPSHAKGAIGAINNVFGGGNAAKVIGTPHVNIGTLTGEVITLASKPIEDSEGNAPTAENWTSYQLVTVEGVDIRGNVYGGGNEADLTGDTEVVIGKNNAVKTYRFTSYGSESGVDAWSSGLAQTTGVIKNGLAEVEILTNGKYVSYVGQKYYVAPNATADGTERTELKNKDGESLSPKLYVAVKPFEQKTYTFTSHSAENGGTQYSTGTAAPTGNFKTFGGQEYMQIVVLTNPNYVSWEGKTFYVSVNAKTDGSETTRLYKADGTAEDVWVSISEQ